MSRSLLSIAALSLVLLPSPELLALDAPRKLVDYDIDVRLDPKSREVDGKETLRWTNPSSERISELKFHLYWNAFRNSRSTFFKESGGQLRGDKADRETGWGYIDVTSMSWDGNDLAKGFRFESPDDGNPDDRTLLSVALPRAVEPGETIELRIGWKARAPKVFARAGYVRDFFMFGQWFPKIAVYEPAGRRRLATGGWNARQYHANSEFYADWGDYKVAITVPESFVVASAGALVDEKRGSGTKTLTYVQKSIHDFAWSADPRYVVKEDVFEPAKDLPAEEVARAAKILGRTPEELRKGFAPVKLRFYMQPDHVRQWTRYAEAQKWTLAWFGLWAFPYPYAQVSVVDPPEDGMGAAGMEYQTIYTAGTSKWLGRWPFDKLRFQETVVIHEFGHGYWAGLLASNEFEESWMDEGINSFTEYEIADRRYSPTYALPFGVGLRAIDFGPRPSIAHGADFDPIVTPSWRFSTNQAYGRNSYPRPAIVLQQLRLLAGEEAFWRGFKSYAERWRFDHPSTLDFLESLEASIGPAYRDVVRKTFFGTAFVDYKVLRARSEEAVDFTGYDDRSKPVNFEEEGRAKETRKDAKKKDEKKLYDTRVVVGRDGELVLPVDVLLTFENGQTHRTRWSGETKWLRLSTVYASKLARVDLDPEGKLVLERDPYNNTIRLGEKKTPSAARKARTYATHLVEIVLSSLWPFL